LLPFLKEPSRKYFPPIIRKIFHLKGYAGHPISKEEKIAPNGISQDNYGKRRRICRYADAISI
jgi:hypothetical protein